MESLRNLNNFDLVSYDRQEEMTDKLFKEYSNSERHYIVVGCGGVGTWVTLFLAMLGERVFTLIDSDKLESTNLNRLPFPQTWQGINKAVALRKLIRQIRPVAIVSVVPDKLNKETLEMYKGIFVRDKITGYYNSKTFVIDCTDDARSQQEIRKYFIDNKRTDLEYLKIGYEGFKVGAYKQYDVWIGEDYQAGYRTSQANVLSSAFSGILGILKLYDNNQTDISINMLDLIRTKESLLLCKYCELPLDKCNCLICEYCELKEGACTCDYCPECDNKPLDCDCECNDCGARPIQCDCGNYDN